MEMGEGMSCFWALDESMLLELESKGSASVIRGVTAVNLCLTAVKTLLTGVKASASDLLFSLYYLLLENLPASGRFFSFSLDESQLFRLFIDSNAACPLLEATDSNRSDFQLSRFGSTAVRALCLPTDSCN